MKIIVIKYYFYTDVANKIEKKILMRGNKMLLECRKKIGIIILHFLRAVETLYTSPILYVICTVTDWKIEK